ncbi:MAG: tetratricopeptide repeat protein [Rhodocyclaceae bacterium]|nr:tetratricopeptide repeat protein [Rhodocyclaceae bacterium]
MTQSSLERAVALHQSGQLDAAETAYRAILAIEPDHAHARHYLGVLALQRDDAASAAAWITEALALRPAEPAFLCSLGQARRREGRFAEAEAAYRQAVKRAPSLFQAWHNLAALYESAGDDVQAIECFERARTLAAAPYPGDAGLAVACRRQGFRLLDLGQPAAAAVLFRRACELKPADAGTWGALASSETLAGRPLVAQAAFERALALAPDDPQLLNNRANALRDAGRLDEAMAAYEAAIARAPGYLEARSNLLFAALSAATDAASLVALVQRHGAAFEDLGGADQPTRASAHPPRIGLVSGDLRAHPVAWFMLGWFAHRERARFHVTAYHAGAREDAVSARIREGCDAWVPCAEMDDETLAARIADDGIDLLVDLAGHTADNRLGVFARRPATRQVSFLGYAGTTGLDCFDARIADALTEPDAEAWSSEPLIRLPGSYLCYTPPIEAPRPAPLPLRKNRYVTFGCATQLAKLTDATLALWSAALARVPRHRLLLRSMTLDDPLVRKSVMARMAAAGIDVSRVRLEGPKPLDAHIKAWRQVDIALDTTPFNLATQSCDALWMGVPLVTLSGDRHAGRLGASLLHALGLPELVATSPQAFAGICAALAADPDRLEALRADLRSRLALPGAPCDAAGFAGGLDAAFAEVLSRPAGSRGASSR